MLPKPTETWVVAWTWTDDERTSYWTRDKSLYVLNALSGTVCTFATKQEAVAAFRKGWGRMPHRYRAVKLSEADAALVRGESIPGGNTKPVPDTVTAALDKASEKTEPKPAGNPPGPSHQETPEDRSTALSEAENLEPIDAEVLEPDMTKDEVHKVFDTSARLAPLTADDRFGPSRDELRRDCLGELREAQQYLGGVLGEVAAG